MFTSKLLPTIERMLPPRVVMMPSSDAGLAVHLLRHADAHEAVRHEDVDGAALLAPDLAEEQAEIAARARRGGGVGRRRGEQRRDRLIDELVRPRQLLRGQHAAEPQDIREENGSRSSGSRGASPDVMKFTKLAPGRSARIARACASVSAGSPDSARADWSSAAFQASTTAVGSRATRDGSSSGPTTAPPEAGMPGAARDRCT